MADKDKKVNQKAGGFVSFGKTEVIQTVNEAPERLLLVPPFEAVEYPQGKQPSNASLLDTLKVSDRVPLFGRDEAMDRATKWLATPSPINSDCDHRVAVIYGPGGAGKTRLAAEILRKAEEEEWTAGFLPGDRQEEPDWPWLSHPRRPTAIAIDYAESRHRDLMNIFKSAPVGHQGQAPLRVILIVREHKAQSESWHERISGVWQLGTRATPLLVDDLQVFSLEESLPDHEDRKGLWKAASRALEAKEADPPAYLESKLFESPLYVMLDAYNDFSSRQSEGSGRETEQAPTAATLIDSILRHERHYWVHARLEAELNLDEYQMNEVAVAATLLNGVRRETFKEALRALPWLSDNDNLLRRVTNWWEATYVNDRGIVRGVLPDMVGEHLVVRALGQQRGPKDYLGGLLQPAQLTSLVAAAGLTGRQRILRVLTRIANSDAGEEGEAARSALAEVLSRHLDEFLPSTFVGLSDDSTAQESGESSATTLASAVIACNALELVASGADDTGDEGSESPTVPRDAALRIVRRQIERVAEREYAGGRWTAERLAQIAVWSLRFNLAVTDAGEQELQAAEVKAKEQIAKIQGLDPLPYLELAMLLLQYGEFLHQLDRHDEAEACYHRSLELLSYAGAETTYAHGLWYRLGRLSSSRGDPAPLTIKRYKKSLIEDAEIDDPVVVTFPYLRIAEQLARGDIDDALEYVATTKKEMEGNGATKEQVEMVESFPSRVLFNAARRAENGRELEQAGDLYRRTLEALAEIGDEESHLAYVICHDLGDVAVATAAATRENGGGDVDGSAAPAGGEGDEDVVALYEKALEGKTKLRGTADSSTVTTLLALCDALAKTDLDAALDRLSEAAAQLDPELHADQLLRMTKTRITLLSDARRFKEATEAARELQDREGLALVRRAIFEAVAEPGRVAGDDSFNARLQMSLLAAKVFSPGDTRLTSLTSNLSTIYVNQTGELLASQMDSSTLDTVWEQIEAYQAAGSKAADPMKLIGESIPHYEQLVIEVGSRVAEQIERSLEEPVISTTVHGGEAFEISDLVDDETLRQWFASSLFDAGALLGTNMPSALALLISFYTGVKLGVLSSPPLDEKSLLEVWTEDGAVPLARKERDRIAADVERVGAPEQAGELSRILDSVIPLALKDSMNSAAKLGEFEVAHDLCQEALGELEESDSANSTLTFGLWEDMGHFLTELGDSEGAVTYFERAYVNRRAQRGATDRATIDALTNLCATIADTDFEAGLKRLKTAAVELEEAGADPQEVRKIEGQRTPVVFLSARRLEKKEQFGLADQRYRLALHELEEAGEGDSRLTYVIWHDLGDVAAADEKDPHTVKELYERAFNGKLKLHGPADPSTLGTFEALCKAQATIDPEGITPLLARWEKALRTLPLTPQQEVALASRVAKFLPGAQPEEAAT